jgi:hypothetical protein
LGVFEKSICWALPKSAVSSFFNPPNCSDNKSHDESKSEHKANEAEKPCVDGK